MKLLRKYSVFLFLLLLFIAPAQSQAQAKRSAHWFFGWNAGLNFNSGTPVADTNSTIFTIEGCASISDTAGNLLFYSDGVNVWNRNHTLMPNGTGLIGNVSSNQSCLIVPMPGDPQRHYLFTNGTLFAYSIIDMNLDNGLGDVVVASKNLALYSNAGEDMAGTLHCNATDYWIIGRQRNSLTTSTYHIYRLTSSGLSAAILFQFDRTNYNVGHLTFSQDGRRLSASIQTNTSYIFDFDRQTGNMTLQDSIVSPGNGSWVYSTAFSPDNSKLYATIWEVPGYCYVSQFDRNASNLTTSRVNLDSVDFSNGSPNGYGYIGRMQIASDQRIYISRWALPYPYTCSTSTSYCIDSLDAILQPNNPGMSCNFQRGVISLDGKATMIGLPAFVSQFTAVGIPLYMCEPTGINETFNENELTLFPNPLSEWTEIRLKQYETNCVFEVYNAAGVLVRSQPVPSAHFYFEAEGLGSGIYFCRIQLANRVLTGKLVIVD